MEGAAVYRRSKVWRFSALAHAAVAGALREAKRLQGVRLDIREPPDIVKSLLEVSCCAKSSFGIVESKAATGRAAGRPEAAGHFEIACWR